MENALATISASRSSGDRAGVRGPSILFDDSEDRVELREQAPAYFADLNLDRVVDRIVGEREHYDLRPFFYTPLPSVDAVAYRHEVWRDLEDEQLFSRLKAFATQMHELHADLSHHHHVEHDLQRHAWLVETADIYCRAAAELADDLAEQELRSRGLRRFAEYLSDYVASEEFRALVAESKQVREALAGIRYRLNIKGDRVTVSRYQSQADFSVEVLEIFEKFRQGEAGNFRDARRVGVGMNHIEAQILDLVAKLYPQVFAGLAGYYQRHRDFFDPVVASFDRELQFYISFLEFIDPLKGAGLSFCHPRVSADSKELLARESFDLALADVLVSEGSTIICNDFELRDAERIIVVSGPNQGGKTTFARMFGQLHHLASLGCLVPGSSARLFLFDEIFTHFEREEELTRLSGKLEDDLLRIHEILEKATSESVVIMNESLTSTTLSDALLLSRAIMEQMIERGLLGVYVTFIDELATLGPATVSMVSTVEPDDPAKRTFKVLRRPADGRAYALAIAEKHGLTARRIRERIGR